MPRSFFRWIGLFKTPVGLRMTLRLESSLASLENFFLDR